MRLPRGVRSWYEGRRDGRRHGADFCDAAGMSILAYARVSSGHQSLDAQRDALTGAGAERIFTDQLSGAREDRPGLAALLAYARFGDTVVVVALDRLGRSLSSVIRTIETLTEAGCCCAGCGRSSTTPPPPGGCSPASSPPSPATNAT